MASLKLSHIYKVYENGHKAVNDFSIDIEDKEFIVFVGPSGCGKSTTLRMIAGLEQITAGDLFIGDTLVNDMEPKDRDIAMVFQNYALYPHMTVYENMAFGLRNRHMKEEDIKAKVLEAAKILDIEEYLDRKPKAMSGGQRQRVALGRAIVRDPKVFLLDEPLSNLDAKLRAQMRIEISKLHKKLATTFIYVTHDQVEAMTMGTRIVVMKLGYVQQIDTPMNLYNKPYNKFVAGFIGTPQMNFFDVTLNRVGEKVEVKFADNQVFDIPYESVSKIHDSYIHGNTKVILGIRPDHIRINQNKEGIKVLVSAIEQLGNENIIYGDLGSDLSEFTMKDKGTAVIIKTIDDVNVKNGDVIYISLNDQKIHLFDHETEITLMNPIPTYSLVNASINNEKLHLFNKDVNLPETFAKALNGATNFDIEIPPSAIVRGNDFTLDVALVEEVEGKHLAYLRYEDRYLFALVDENVKKGDKYAFSLLNERIKVLVDNNCVLEPIKDEESLVGTFSKSEIRENKERVLHFFINIEGSSIECPQNNGYKLNSVDGNDCYKKSYRYEFKRDDIAVIKENSDDKAIIHGEVIEILDYGNKKFARFKVNDQEILINGMGLELGPCNILINGENISIYEQEIDMKIC